MADESLRLVVLGDSVPWGQGLKNEHKYWTILRSRLEMKGHRVDADILAHSGAVTGVGWPPGDGDPSMEVPVAYPTVLQQVAAVPRPSEVNVVLLTTAINDINIRRILNPLTLAPELRVHTHVHCYANMRILLRAALQTFSKPTLKVYLTGYYPIFSTESELLRVPAMLENFKISHGFTLNQGPILKKVVQLSLQFWRESEAYLEQAAADANAAEGRNAVTFVRSPFTESNAVFASDPWLFGLSSDFEPQDEVIDSRNTACVLAYRDPLDLANREQCYRASAGHPNVTGAQKIADAVWKHID